MKLMNYMKRCATYSRHIKGIEWCATYLLYINFIDSSESCVKSSKQLICVWLTFGIALLQIPSCVHACCVTYIRKDSTADVARPCSSCAAASRFWSTQIWRCPAMTLHFLVTLRWQTQHGRHSNMLVSFRLWWDEWCRHQFCWRWWWRSCVLHSENDLSSKCTVFEVFWDDCARNDFTTLQEVFRESVQEVQTPKDKVLVLICRDSMISNASSRAMFQCLHSKRCLRMPARKKMLSNASFQMLAFKEQQSYV